jgi:hypothetical protein
LAAELRYEEGLAQAAAARARAEGTAEQPRAEHSHAHAELAGAQAARNEALGALRAEHADDGRVLGILNTSSLMFGAALTAGQSFVGQ